MTNHTNNESAAAGTAAPSGQTSGLTCADDSTSLTTLQQRIGPIRLKARTPGVMLALQLVPPASAVLLTLEEAQRLSIALVELIGDIEADARARDWSRRKMAEIIAAADGSAESYRSKL